MIANAEPGPPPASPPAPAEICDLVKVFRLPLRRGKGIAALGGVSIRLREGEVYGLIGPNGSGKSTALKILLGLLQPTGGTARVFGQAPAAPASRARIGFLPENPYFYKRLTGTETLHFYGRLCGLRGPTLKRQAREMLDLAGLADAADRRVGGYSKGMLQRIGLAQALIHDPDLLLLDEPTAGVDPAGSRRIRDLILAMRKAGKTIVLCSHLLDQVQEVCDRVGIMRYGKLIKEGPVEELLRVEDQTEIRLRAASPALIERISGIIASDADAELLSADAPRTTLERLYIRETGGAE